MAFSYIDIFAGAGGLSEGFQRNGYIPVAHVEMKKEACLTLKTRECFYYLKKHGRIEDYKNYLRREITRDELYAMVPETVLNSVINETMSEEGMPALFDRIDQLMEVQGIENIDVLVGGPPCQAYSLVGRARSKTNMVGDPRNYLYMLYCEVLEKYRPKIFVFENVPGLLTANGGSYFDDMRERFRKAGYFLLEIQTCVSYAYLFFQLFPPELSSLPRSDCSLILSNILSDSPAVLANEYNTIRTIIINAMQNPIITLSSFKLVAI